MLIDLSDLCCVNSKCPDLGKRGSGNLKFVRWIQKAKDVRFVGCRTCGVEFSEFKGTPYFRSKLPRREFDKIVEHVAEGDGMRKTARLTRHDLGTVLRITRVSGQHAEAFHQQKAQHLRVQEVQLDEKWSFVGKKAGSSDVRGACRRSAGG